MDLGYFFLQCECSLGLIGSGGSLKPLEPVNLKQPQITDSKLESGPALMCQSSCPLVPTFGPMVLAPTEVISEADSKLSDHRTKFSRTKVQHRLRSQFLSLRRKRKALMKSVWDLWSVIQFHLLTEQTGQQPARRKVTETVTRPSCLR